MVDIKNLTDSELQQQLIKHGYDPGPIIPSTRQINEDKLLQFLTVSSSSTEHNVKKKTEEPHQDLESEEEEENFDDITLERSIKISPKRTRRPTEENSTSQKSAKPKNYEIEECGSPLPLHSKKLPAVYSVDGDIDIYYPDPRSHTGIRITIRRPSKTEREDPRTMLEDVNTVETKVGVVSIAFIIAVLLIFTLILFVYLTTEKKVITV
ncbi:LEM domain-containing protein 1 [Notamacropus eugenii]|uniref:LEM domain-containing protein 1 n=1 Tax=Notamacropus eugenii TaxID=9315 RepID=UPI003B6830FA